MLGWRMRAAIAVAAGLCVAAVATPARAQLLDVQSGTTAYGPDTCADTSKPGTDGVITVEYTYQQLATASSYAEQLFVTHASCPSVSSGSSSVDLPSDAVVLVAANTSPSAFDTARTATLHVSNIAQNGCATSQTTTANVCYYEFYTPTAYIGGSSTPVAATKSLTLTYDSQAPGAPRIDTVSSGDQHLHVAVTAPGDDDIQSYDVFLVELDGGGSTGSEQSALKRQAAASDTGSTGSAGSDTGTTTAGSTGSAGSDTGSTAAGSTAGSTGSDASSSTGSGSTGSSSSGSSSGSTTATSITFDSAPCPDTKLVYNVGNQLGVTVPNNSQLLVDGTPYSVQVRARDNSGNTGPCSTPVIGTPQLVDDFWRLYKQDGGQDPGGCGAAGGGLGLIGLALALGLARARKGRTP